MLDKLRKRIKIACRDIEPEKENHIRNRKIIQKTN